MWNISFIKFWKDVPNEIQSKSIFYIKKFWELNFGGVWTNDYNIKPYITPQWIRLPRFFIKVLFLFRDRERWYDFEKRYLAYWMNIICGLCINSYFKTIKNSNGFRHAVSWLALKMEKIKYWKELELVSFYELEFKKTP